MSAVKTILKAGIGAAAAVMGAGALVYECALNTKLNSFFVDLFDHRSDVKQETQSEDCACPREPGWFDRHKGDDHIITTEATGRIHAYIIPAEKPSHKWAILCHGYNSDPASVGVFAEHYRPLGYHCICPSLRGWGNDEKPASLRNITVRWAITASVPRCAAGATMKNDIARWAFTTRIFCAHG